MQLTLCSFGCCTCLLTCLLWDDVHVGLDLTNATAVEIADFYQPTPDNWVRANMVISKDGHFVDSSGSSRGLSSPLDLKVLLVLRAISDAVLVGAETVRTENYRPPALAGEFVTLNSKAARLVVLSRSLSFDPASRLFENPGNPPIIVTDTKSDPAWQANKQLIGARAEIMEFTCPLNLNHVIQTLASKGLTKIVCEGGPDLLAQLIDAQLVDELDITHSPVSVGSAAANSSIHTAMATWPMVAEAKLGEHVVNRYTR